jgi:cysteine-rich repeat protein
MAAILNAGLSIAGVTMLISGNSSRIRPRPIPELPIWGGALMTEQLLMQEKSRLLVIAPTLTLLQALVHQLHAALAANPVTECSPAPKPYCGDSICNDGFDKTCEPNGWFKDDKCVNNQDVGDIRNGDCRTTGAYACTYCGDGVVQAGAGEECDDGNTNNNDGLRHKLPHTEKMPDDHHKRGFKRPCPDR